MGRLDKSYRPFKNIAELGIFSCFIIFSLCLKSQHILESKLERIIYGEGDNLSYPFHAFLSFEHPVSTGIQYLNVMAINPITGISDWAIINLPLEANAMERRVYYRMDLGLVLSEGGWEFIEDFLEGEGGIPLGIYFGEYFTEFSDFNEYPVSWHLHPVDIRHHFVPTGMHRMSHSVIPKFPLLPSPPLIPPITVMGKTRGCEVPNVDLDSLAHPDPVTGDLNSCAPAAAANSLKWLMQVHPEIEDVDSLRGILDTLKMMMKKDSSGPNSWIDVVRGKLAFIDRHQLPIHVKYQTHTPYPSFTPTIPSFDTTYGHFARNETGPTGIPDFDWICSELDKGEDLEMIITYWCDSLGMTTDGRDTTFLVQSTSHSIVLTGYFKIGDHRYLVWKHDIDQSGPGGTIEEFGTWCVDSVGYPYLKELSETPGCIAYLGAVISESYDPDVTFESVIPYEWGYNPFNSPPGVERDSFEAYITFILQAHSQFRFLNIKVCHPVTGEEIWILKNIPLPPNSTDIPVRIKVDLRELAAGDSLPSSLIFKIRIGNVENGPDFIPRSMIHVPGIPIPYRIHFGGRIGPHPFIPRIPRILLPPILPEGMMHHLRGCEVPNIDLDGDLYPLEPDDPSTSSTSDISGCGPAAAANSLSWLDSHHLEDDPPLFIPLTLRQITDSLKILMKTNQDGPGTLWTDFITGKLAFIDKYKLPITVKYQAHATAPDSIESPITAYGSVARNKSLPNPENDTLYLHPNFEWLASELEDDEDVEILLGYYCDTMIVNIDTLTGVMDTVFRRVRTGGHYVNVTGYVMIGAHKWITYKHDVYQGGPGGTRADNTPEGFEYTDFSEWLVDSAGYAELWRESYTHDSTYCAAFVESVITESYDPEKSFCPGVVTSTADNGPGSLREAIECAMPGDTIRFDESLCSMDIILQDPIIIDKNVVILFPDNCTVSLKAADSAIGLLLVTEEGDVTILNGSLYAATDMEGAAIYNEGRVVLEDTIIQFGENTPLEASLVHNKGELTIRGSTVIRGQ
ncbi:MAG TPA: hypothetical protein PKC30_00325 [Saprospiraceae bacterium]|nr:hypothetical protein [Saprospiraceae bacterium]